MHTPPWSGRWLSGRCACCCQWCTLTPPLTLGSFASISSPCSADWPETPTFACVSRLLRASARWRSPPRDSLTPRLRSSCRPRRGPLLPASGSGSVEALPELVPLPLLVLAVLWRQTAEAACCLSLSPCLCPCLLLLLLLLFLLLSTRRELRCRRCRRATPPLARARALTLARALTQPSQTGAAAWTGCFTAASLRRQTPPLPPPPLPLPLPLPLVLPPHSHPHPHPHPQYQPQHHHHHQHQHQQLQLQPRPQQQRPTRRGWRSCASGCTTGSSSSPTSRPGPALGPALGLGVALGLELELELGLGLELGLAVGLEAGSLRHRPRPQLPLQPPRLQQPLPLRRRQRQRQQQQRTAH